MEKKPVIQVFALGGTIAMTPGDRSGVTPTLSAAELVRAVPDLVEMAEFRAETLVQKGSANLTCDLISDLCNRAEASDADAVIVTQGTDSMEETSFLASLVYKGDRPLIFTGAMRTPNQPGADGPANLLDAVRAALSAPAGSVSLVMNGEVHDPWCVAKEHTSTLQAFSSEQGPVAVVSEGHVYWRRAARKGHGLKATSLAPVALVGAVLDDDGRMLDMLPSLGYKAVVIEAYGAGHLSELWACKAEKLAAEMPVILASRTRGGRVFEATYGYKGAEIDLIARGLVPAGGLRGRKARLLLSLLLVSDKANWKQTFTAVGKSV
ncbi:asparaginase [Kordiimonas aestuarii]|uniref:asparaginase n=1 Tax=Kordiimonas aestuarii TaxID=1005925 RepID=UPI0021D02E83|nr:asparaginase [Kordiimonas aestuarii]